MLVLADAHRPDQARCGILTGRPATTHWATRDALAALGARVSTDRVVVDGDVITRAAVAAGIDMALHLAARLWGEYGAKLIQLALEHDPQPPPDAGSPEEAGPELTAAIREGVLPAQRGYARAVAQDEHRVYLLRHGTTAWSQTGQHTSRSDIPLTVEGELRARQAGQTLTALRPAGPVTVLASPRQRAQRTAALAGLGDIVAEPLLAEWDYGDYEGLTTAQIREQVPDWTVWTHPCPGGETAEQVAARADALLARVADTTSDVVLVGHGHFSRCLIARWLGLPATAGVRFALDPAGITVLGRERDVPQVVRANIPPWQQG